MNFFKRVVGILVGKLVLRAQLIPIGKLEGLRGIWTRLFPSASEVKRLNSLWDQFIERNKQHAKKNPQLHVEVQRNLLRTPQGVFLDTVELCASGTKPEECVIYGWGRNDCYEMNLSRLASDALNLKKKIITFNMRGVAHSVGQVVNEQDLINDHIFQIQRLLDQGVPPQNIKFYAHSLAASIAAHAVHKFNAKGKPISLYSDRSFDNLIDTSVDLYFGRPYARARIVNVGTMILATLLLGTLAALSMITLLQTSLLWVIALMSVKWKQTHEFYDFTIGRFMEKSMRFLMKFGGWELKHTEVFEKIPMQRRNHSVLRQPRKVRSRLLGYRKIETPAAVDQHLPIDRQNKSSPELDRVIHFHHSYHRHAKKYRTDKNRLKLQLKRAQNTGLYKSNIKNARAELIHKSNSKMIGGDHMTDPKDLVCWYKDPIARRWMTGQERIYDFIEPEGGHRHPVKKRYKAF